MDIIIRDNQSLKEQLRVLHDELISPWSSANAEKLLDRELTLLHKFIVEHGGKDFSATLSFDESGTLSIDLCVTIAYVIDGTLFDNIHIAIKYGKDFDCDTTNLERGGNISLQFLNISEKIIDDKYYSEHIVVSEDKVFFIRKANDLKQVNAYECLNDLFIFLEGSCSILMTESIFCEKNDVEHNGNNSLNSVEIYFTTKAYVQLLTEIADYPYVETGGVLVGQRRGNTFYIFETVDPGFKADRQRAEFSRHYEYTEHLAYKVANQYEGETTVVGYYHRHPGSYDHFSGGDDVSNLEFAQTFNGVISGLVNIDPDFRLAFYYISPDGRQSRSIPYKVDDRAFDGILRLKSIDNLLAIIKAQENKYTISRTKIFSNSNRRNNKISIWQKLKTLFFRSSYQTDSHTTTKAIFGYLEEDISNLKKYSPEISFKDIEGASIMFLKINTLLFVIAFKVIKNKLHYAYLKHEADYLDDKQFVIFEAGAIYKAVEKYISTKS